MSGYTQAEPFDPATMCHPIPAVSGGDGCPNVQPCTLRCHLRYLEDWPQPNDWMFNGSREAGDLPKLCGHGVDADCECRGDDQPTEGGDRG